MKYYGNDAFSLLHLFPQSLPVRENKNLKQILKESKMYDLIIENANLVTCDKNHNVIWNASMAIADGSIQVIESDLSLIHI